MDKTISPRPPIVTILGHVDHGKCVSPDTLIPVPDGRILTAEDLFRKLAKDGMVERKSGGWVVFPRKTSKLFSFDYKSVVDASILAAWKLPSPRYLYETNLISGDKLLTTPEHPYFVFTPEGKVVEKTADNLVSGEHVLVPKNLHFASSLIQLKKDLLTNLKNSENWVVFLDKARSKELLKKMKKSGYNQLLKAGLITTRFDKVSQDKIRLRAKDFLCLTDHFEFSLLEAYKMIAYIKNATPKWRAGHTSNKIRLPQSSSDFKKLGYVIGCLIGDGYIPEAVLDNNDKEIQDSYASCMEEVFEVQTKVKKGHTCERVVTTGGKTLTRFLTDIFGLPMFDKSAKVSIPQLLQTYQPMVKSVIEGWFDTDGYVSLINHCIEFTSKSEILVRQVGFYFLGYGIHSAIYQKNSFWYLRIANKPYLDLFVRNFSPRLKRKRDRIMNAVARSSTSRIFDITPLNGSYIKNVSYSNERIPYFNRYKEYKNLSRPFVRKLLGLGLINSSKEFGAVVNTEVSPIRVKRVKKTQSKDKWVYDFTVDGIHNFVANRIFVHNTTLLDAVRQTDVVSREKGGITQGIGAWAVTLPPEAGTKEGKKITFIDTPGHAAFSDMRREGASVADVVLLVVDGADGVKPQTKESLSLIKEANIAYIVVLTKSDLPTFSENTVLGELEKEGVALETRGGSVPYISVSAKTKEGIPALLELILLLSELNNVSSDKEAPLAAVVIEASKEKAGITASLVVRNGTLKVKDAVFVGGNKVKVRGLFNDRGKGISSAYPGEPAKAIGFTELPTVGAMVTSVKKAAFSSDLPKVDRDYMKDVKIKIVLKAKTEGGRKAVIKNLPTGVFVVASQTGDVSGSDVLAAKASQAKVFVFEASIPASSLKLAESEGVVIERFQIIYELLERLDKLVAGKSEVTTGKAEIVAIFPFEDTKVAGMRVKEGKIRKADAITLDKKDKKYGNLKIVSMKRGKDDISEAKMGEEFGAIFSPKIDFAIGDMILSVAHNG